MIRLLLAALALCSSGLVVPASAEEGGAAEGIALAEFWFVEANEGQSAGGHAALRIGSRIYHLEHRGDGLIADRRTSPLRFLEVYAERGNRRIEAIPLDLDPAQTRRLERDLAARFFERTRKLGELDALEDEIRWLQRAGELGSLALDIPGLGLFEVDQGALSKDCGDHPYQTRHAGDPRSQFRARLIHRFGEAALRDRRLAARREIKTQTIEILAPLPEFDGKEHDKPSSRDSPGGRLRSLTQAARTEFALDLLLGCGVQLRPNALRGTQTPLSKNRASWLRAQTQLAEAIEALLESPRKDTGLPLLLAWGRMAAIQRTLESNEIHVLAPFEEHPEHTPRGFSQSSASIQNEIPAEWRAQRQQGIDARWEAAIDVFVAREGPLEARLLGMERAHHARRHFDEQTLHDPIRPESRSPSAAEAYAGASRILPWPQGIPFSALGIAQRHREEAAASLRRSLAHALRYGLFTRNCVTELIAALEATPDDGRLRFAEVIQGTFIPEVAAQQVERSFGRPGRQRRIQPSSRERALAQARRKIQSPLSRVAFESRELFPAVSRTYRPNQDDSRFLAFSGGPVLFRPFIGLANLGWGVAGSLFGLFEAPFDRGVGLRRGVQGIAMSVPELFFFQVRRGSYRAAPPPPISPPFAPPPSASAPRAPDFASSAESSVTW